MDLSTLCFFNCWMDETVMPKFKAIIHFMLFLRWYCLLCSILSVNVLASYSSEEYCKVLSQQTIPLTLYVFVVCLLAANRAHNASEEL